MLSLFLLTALLQAAPQAPDQALSPAAGRDKPAAPATIRGKVTAADTGAVVKRAQITLRNTHRPMEPVSVTADAQGVFEAKNLEAGSYHATCAKTGYVSMGYKAKHADQESETITLSAGQVLKDVDFQLIRGGAIAGIVIDEDGDPISGVSVQAMAKMFEQGKAMLMPKKSVQTDDRGAYRLYDLAPGRYYVQAGGKSFMSMAVSMGQDTSPPYPIVIYPSATRTGDARAIAMPPGGEITGINMQMRSSNTYSVSGRIIDTEAGKPAGGAMLMVTGDDVLQGMSAAPTQTRPDGTFHVTGLAPGHYRMMIMNVSAIEKGGAPGLPLMRGFDVGGADLTDLTIALGPGAAVKGQIKADGGAIPEHGMARLMSMREDDLMGGGAGSIKPDGSFEIAGVQPGTYELSVSPGMGGASDEKYFLRDIMAANRDVSDTGIIVPESGSIEVSATLDFHSSTITGNVVDEEGKPVARAGVVLVSADPKKRRGDRYFKDVTADSNGAFKISGVIPGDYLLVPWGEEHPEQVQDPDVFAAVEKYATSVNVQGGGTATQDLKMSKELRTITRTFTQ